MLVWLCVCRTTQTIRVLGNDLRAAQKRGAKQGRPKTGFSLVRSRWTWVNDVRTLSAAADRKIRKTRRVSTKALQAMTSAFRAATHHGMQLASNGRQRCHRGLTPAQFPPQGMAR